MIIAIDGPAGSGKSSTAKLVAQKLQIHYLDTGAMYRAITLKCVRQNIDINDINALSQCVKTTSLEFTGMLPNISLIMDGEDITAAIRSDKVTSMVSDYCKPKVVREHLVAQQRAIGHKESIVCEGRDITTVVFPHADFKFYMTASVQERAKRRQKDFERQGVNKTVSELISEIEQRDFKDSSRENSPLCMASDAELIDTTNMSFQQQVEYIVSRVLERQAGI